MARRRDLVRRAALLAPLLALACCGMSDEAALRLARAGRIDAHARVQLRLAADIDADPARVLAVLTAVDRWPRVFHAIGEAHLDGPAAPGARFTWTAGGVRIRSVLARADAGGVAWVGMPGASRRSMSGCSPRAARTARMWRWRSRSRASRSRSFMSARAVRDGDAAWLADLRRAGDRGGLIRHGPPGATAAAWLIAWPANTTANDETGSPAASSARVVQVLQVLNLRVARPRRVEDASGKERPTRSAPAAPAGSCSKLAHTKRSSRSRSADVSGMVAIVPPSP